MVEGMGGGVGGVGGYLSPESYVQFVLLPVMPLFSLAVKGSDGRVMADLLVFTEGRVDSA